MKKMVLSLVALFVVLTFYIYMFRPVNIDWTWGSNALGIDWKNFFRGSVLALIHGESPYGNGFFNPPWVLLPLIPVALLSPALGTAILYSLNYVAFIFATWKLK